MPVINRRVIVISPNMTDTTTFIRNISEITISDPPPDANPSVISMNFGRTTLMDVVRVYWFGIPYGLDYAEMWHIIGRDLLGIIVVFGGDAPDDAATLVSALSDFAPQRVLVAHTTNMPPVGNAIALAIDGLDRQSAWRSLGQLLNHMPADGYTDAIINAFINQNLSQ